MSAEILTATTFCNRFRGRMHQSSSIWLKLGFQSVLEVLSTAPCLVAVLLTFYTRMMSPCERKITYCVRHSAIVSVVECRHQSSSIWLKLGFQRVLEVLSTAPCLVALLLAFYTRMMCPYERKITYCVRHSANVSVVECRHQSSSIWLKLGFQSVQEVLSPAPCLVAVL